MPDNPVPLREALREAVESLLDEQSDVEVMLGRNDDAGAQVAITARNVALDRVAALIEQIPIVFEAREGDDG